MPNSLKSQVTRFGLSATELAPRPGDFPLGSPESRAAARAKVQHKPRLTFYERDCLLIHSLVPLSYAYSPNARDLDETDVGRCGRELGKAQSPINPTFRQQERRFAQCRDAHLHFYLLHQRLPASGDLLNRTEIEARWGVQTMAHDVAKFRAAWARRLPQLPCPVKFEQDRAWRRSAESKPGNEVWEEDYVPWTAAEIWPLIEAEALGKEAPSTEAEATIDAVVFQEDENSDFYTKPAGSMHARPRKRN